MKAKTYRNLNMYIKCYKIPKNGDWEDSSVSDVLVVQKRVTRLTYKAGGSGTSLQSQYQGERDRRTPEVCCPGNLG